MKLYNYIYGVKAQKPAWQNRLGSNYWLLTQSSTHYVTWSFTMLYSLLLLFNLLLVTKCIFINAPLSMCITKYVLLYEISVKCFLFINSRLKSNPILALLWFYIWSIVIMDYNNWNLLQLDWDCCTVDRILKIFTCQCNLIN